MSKQELLKLINDMPNDASVEDLMYRLYIIDKHNHAMADIQNGDVLTADELRASIIKNA